MLLNLVVSYKNHTFAKRLGEYYPQLGEMAEWSIAAVLKTVEGNTSGGSNPSLSANKGVNQQVMRFTPFITPEKFLGILV